MSKLNEYMEEMFKRYDKINDFAALALALEAAKKKYNEQMDKVCHFETLFCFLSYHLSPSLSVFFSPSTPNWFHFSVSP